MDVSDDEKEDEKIDSKKGKMDEEGKKTKKEDGKNFYGNYKEISDKNFTKEMKELVELGLDKSEVDYYMRKRKLSKEETIEHFLFVNFLILKKKLATFERKIS